MTRHLLALGRTVRAGDLDPQVVADRSPDAEPVHLDLTDPATFAPVLTGVRRVFLMRPPAIARVGPTINRFLDAAVDAGVEHVVFSSVAGGESNPIVPHHRIERHLLASGLGWTVLRPGFFAQNLGGAYRRDIRCEGASTCRPAAAGWRSSTSATSVNSRHASSTTPRLTATAPTPSPGPRRWTSTPSPRR